MSAIFDSKVVEENEVEDLRGPAIIVSGSVASGFKGHGPFVTVKAALEWWTEEKQIKYGYCTVVILVNSLNMLFGDFVLVGTTGLANPYFFFGPFDTPQTAAQVAAVIVENTDVPVMFDILPISKEEKDAEPLHDNNV